jgi:hypothetical protein
MVWPNVDGANTVDMLRVTHIAVCTIRESALGGSRAPWFRSNGACSFEHHTHTSQLPNIQQHARAVDGR